MITLTSAVTAAKIAALKKVLQDIAGEKAAPALRAAASAGVGAPVTGVSTHSTPVARVGAHAAPITRVGTYIAPVARVAAPVALIAWVAAPVALIAWVAAPIARRTSATCAPRIAPAAATAEYRKTSAPVARSHHTKFLLSKEMFRVYILPLQFCAVSATARTSSS